MSDTREIRAADQELLLPFGLSPHDLARTEKRKPASLRFVPGEPKRREDSRLGGLPYWRVGATWPTCKRCGEPLVFLIQWHAHDIPDLPRQPRLALVFIATIASRGTTPARTPFAFCCCPSKTRWNGFLWTKPPCSARKAYRNPARFRSAKKPIIPTPKRRSYA